MDIPEQEHFPQRLEEPSAEKFEVCEESRLKVYITQHKIMEAQDMFSMTKVLYKIENSSNATSVWRRFSDFHFLAQKLGGELVKKVR
jgi:hypothetical protein